MLSLFHYSKLYLRILICACQIDLQSLLQQRWWRWWWSDPRVARSARRRTRSMRGCVALTPVPLIRRLHLHFLCLSRPIMWRRADGEHPLEAALCLIILDSFLLKAT